MRRIANPLKGVFPLPRVRIPASPPDTLEPRRGRARLALLAAALAFSGAWGCVERTIHVRAEPPGTRVYLEGRRLAGPPPAAPSGEPSPAPAVVEPFVAYGTRHVTLIHPDHRPVRHALPLGVPWYQLPPLDLVCDLLVPWTIRDVHELEVTLEPWEAPGDEEAARAEADALLERAESFREAE